MVTRFEKSQDRTLDRCFPRRPLRTWMVLLDSLSKQGSQHEVFPKLPTGFKSLSAKTYSELGFPRIFFEKQWLGFFIYGPDLNTVLF